jgi:hypothetical protein
VRVTAPGSLKFQSEVLVVDNQSRTLDVVLKPAPGAVPSWVWVAGGVLVAGLGTAGYFLLRSAEEQKPRGSLGHVELSLGRSR